MRAIPRVTTSLQTRRVLVAIQPHIREAPVAVQCSKRYFFGSSWGGNKDGGDDAGKGDGGTAKGSTSAPAESTKAPTPNEGKPVAAESSEASTADAKDMLVPVGGSKTLSREGEGVAPLLALPVRRRPLFPGQRQLLQVTHPDVVKELQSSLEKGSQPRIGLFLKRGEEESVVQERPDSTEHAEDLKGVDPLEALHQVGSRARIIQASPFSQQSDGVEGMQLILHGHSLVRLEKVLSTGPPLQVQVSPYPGPTKHVDRVEDTDQIKAYINETMHTMREIMKISPQFQQHATMLHQGFQRMERGDPVTIAHFAASMTTGTGPELMTVLEEERTLEKMKLALALLKKELEVAQLQQKIASQIEEKMSTTQREFFLREQMRMIKKELGEDKNDGMEKLVHSFRQRLEEKKVPKDAKEAIDGELEKFATLVKESQEYQITRNYLDWLTVLPWGIHSEDTLSLAKARHILDRDHYGMTDVKERILELIAVGVLKGTVQGQILCIVGPPGVGKTSIGRSIAAALNREFYRFSVGGLYDVAEIKGHRRTYVGAMPGKVVQCLKKVQTSNPLVLIDEVDKIGRGHQGDPASALLELLDPSQNSNFLDHYLDVPVDCSRVLFVCTANTTDTIPGPLLDRMEVIRLSGYDSQEKLKIAQDYLVPASMREAGLWPSLEAESSDAVKAEGSSTERADAKIDCDALESLIRWYCREAGVRNLQKHIEKICRKLTIKVVEQKEAKTASEDEAAAGEESSIELRVTADTLSDYVGKQKFLSDRLYEDALPAGTVTGLAWTPMGGTVLYIEATAFARSGGDGGSGGGGRPSLSVTGQLGNVMKESSQLALLIARKHVSSFADDDKRKSFFEKHEVHVHCPEGSTPKDGPSAGVTMVTALLSLALECPIRPDLAMTGEVSLNGMVLPVGGIKEKTIAARRAGCKALILPEANRRDFDELPEYVREGLEVHFATQYSDVAKVALPEPRRGD